jgi:hypothetical protein
MSAAIDEARALICSAMSDVGATCERLRDLEHALPASPADAWEDVLSFATQACEVLGEVTNLSAKMVEFGDPEPTEGKK